MLTHGATATNIQQVLHPGTSSLKRATGLFVQIIFKYFICLFLFFIIYLFLFFIYFYFLFVQIFFLYFYLFNFIFISVLVLFFQIFFFCRLI